MTLADLTKLTQACESMTFPAYFSLQSTKSQPCGHDGFVPHKRRVFLAVLSHFRAQPTKSQPHGHDGFVPHKRRVFLAALSHFLSSP